MKNDEPCIRGCMADEEGERNKHNACHVVENSSKKARADDLGAAMHSRYIC